MSPRLEILLIVSGGQSRLNKTIFARREIDPERADFDKPFLASSKTRFLMDTSWNLILHLCSYDSLPSFDVKKREEYAVHKNQP